MVWDMGLKEMFLQIKANPNQIKDHVIFNIKLNLKAI